VHIPLGGSVAEWLACCGLRRRRDWVQIVAATLSGHSLGQTIQTHRASVQQAAKLVTALLRVARVTAAGLTESNGSLPPGLWLTSPAGWLPRTGISTGNRVWATFYYRCVQLSYTTQHGVVLIHSPLTISPKESRSSKHIQAFNLLNSLKTF